MSRSLDPERPRNYIQERKNKKKKLILFLKFLWPQREIDRECKKKKFKCQNNKIHQIKFGYYPDANNFEIIFKKTQRYIG